LDFRSFMQGLAAFVRALDQSAERRLSVANATNPLEIVVIALSLGFEISVEELRLHSRQLTAAYWPWAGQGHSGRRAFFSEPADFGKPADFGEPADFSKPLG